MHDDTINILFLAGYMQWNLFSSFDFAAGVPLTGRPLLFSIRPEGIILISLPTTNTTTTQTDTGTLLTTAYYVYSPSTETN